MKYLITAILIVSVLISCEKDDQINSNPVEKADSVALGAGYPNDVFYSLSEGEALNTLRNTWDIGFRTNAFSSSVIINRAAGVELYEISKDTNDWYYPVDTTGFRNSPSLNNSTEDWEVGAFSANMTSHPDYGWGKYDSESHDLIGSAVFMIITKDGSAKKIFIRRKHSVASTYYFVYSDLDGSNEHSVVLDLSDDMSKEFVYYSLTDNQVVDEQPGRSEWDLWFTKYYDPSVGPQQLVTGVLINPSAKAMRVEGVSHESADTTMGTFSDNPDAIGYDWKTLDYTTFEYSVVDDLTFFVKTSGQGVYKLYFTSFDRNTGTAAFIKQRVK